MKKFKVGAVGAGHATRTLTIPAFKLVPRELAELKAVCDPNMETAQKLSTPEKINAYSALEEMIEKEKLDVVIINAPMALHASLAIKAMEMGCDVIIEKPAVANLNELHEVKAASDKTGQKFTVVHNYKYYEGPQKALELYKSGVIGDVIHVDRLFLTPPQGDRMEIDKNGWWHKSKGGRLADGLPHMLYLPYMFVGPMELLAVSARKLSKDRPWSFCDDANIVLATAKAHVNIILSTNQESWPYKGYIYHTIIYGTKLTVLCSHHEANILWNGPSRIMKVGAQAAIDYVKQKLSRVRVSRGGHSGFYKAFFDYLNGLGENPAPFEEIYNVAALTDQIGEKMHQCVVEKKKIVY